MIGFTNDEGLEALLHKLSRRLLGPFHEGAGGIQDGKPRPARLLESLWADPVAADYQSAGFGFSRRSDLRKPALLKPVHHLAVVD